MSRFDAVRKRLTETVTRWGGRASAAVSGVKPAVPPWVGRATSRASTLSVHVDPAALKSALEAYWVRAVQTVGVPDRLPREAAPGGERTLSPGVLHLSRAVELHLTQLHKLRDFARARDPIEAVHQLRVTSRRLRTFVDMFAPFTDPELAKAARTPLRKITRAVRDLRDADVQSQGLARRLQHATSEHERIALNHLLDRVRSRRLAYAKRAEKRLRKLDLGELGRALRGLLDQVALRVAAPAASYRLVAEVAYRPIVDEARARAPQAGELPTAESLHEFRLALKQLRYAAELIEPALNGSFEAIHDHAKRLQSLLGEHQDWVEFEKLVSKRRARAVRNGRETLAQGLEGILQGARRERESCRCRCLEECARLPGSALFGGFAPAAPNALPSPRV